MELTTFLILLIIFIIAFSISFFIEDMKYRISYYMILCLMFLAVLNIYLSIVYYIELRNNPGIPGPQGDKGPKGVKGNPGKCSFTETCKIEDARKKILNVAHSMYEIPEKCLDKPSISSCGTQDILEQATPINAQIDMLEKIAYSSNVSEKDFMDKLKVCLKDSGSCMDPTDF
jgi:hypothetical protein